MVLRLAIGTKNRPTIWPFQVPTCLHYVNGIPHDLHPSLWTLYKQTLQHRNQARRQSTKNPRRKISRPLTNPKGPRKLQFLDPRNVHRNAKIQTNIRQLQNESRDRYILHLIRCLGNNRELLYSGEQVKISPLRRRESQFIPPCRGGIMSPGSEGTIHIVEYR